MTDDDINRIKDLVLADPAVKAAGDQLKASARDHADWDESQGAAMQLIIDTAIRRGADELGIAADQAADALDQVGRYFEADAAIAAERERIRQALLTELARMDHVLELADKSAEDGEDVTTVKQLATATRARIVAYLTVLDRRGAP